MINFLISNFVIYTSVVEKVFVVKRLENPNSNCPEMKYRKTFLSYTIFFDLKSLNRIASPSCAPKYLLIVYFILFIFVHWQL